MSRAKIAVGVRVAPKGATKSALSYGYVRALWTGTAEIDGTAHAGREFAEVYWPEIKSAGRWPVDDLRYYERF